MRLKDAPNSAGTEFAIDAMPGLRVATGRPEMTAPASDSTPAAGKPDNGGRSC